MIQHRRQFLLVVAAVIVLAAVLVYLHDTESSGSSGSSAFDEPGKSEAHATCVAQHYATDLEQRQQTYGENAPSNAAVARADADAECDLVK